PVMGKYAAPIVSEPGARHWAIGRAGLLDRGAAEPAAPRYLRLGGRPAAGRLLPVQLLGQFQVRLDEVAVDDWPSGRGRSLFKYLVTHRDPWPRREQLMGAFWPWAAAGAARNSLNVGGPRPRPPTACAGPSGPAPGSRCWCWRTAATGSGLACGCGWTATSSSATRP